MTVELQSGGGAQINLTPRQVALLRLALQRATFVDTPPQHQEETFAFAERLLQDLEPARPE